MRWLKAICWTTSIAIWVCDRPVINREDLACTADNFCIWQRALPRSQS